MDIQSPSPALHFCTECNNLLYPKADRQYNRLYYYCRMCARDQPAGENDSIVYRNDLLTVTKEQMGEVGNLETDPTLAHASQMCPSCHNYDCVIFQDQSKRYQTRMILFYVCTRCGNCFIDPILTKKKRRRQRKDAFDEDEENKRRQREELQRRGLIPGPELAPFGRPLVEEVDCESDSEGFLDCFKADGHLKQEF
ncbi:hypothetical protein BD626DRAFT_484634 [Schizophyllum amplum]|uniref:DNA-directed RNA polymerase II subunit RPB9 n=1 Tax=Schizophyllum amplum TaxID=97359 RepID=A0A550CQI4_9AGAR|nr:hypothetical protein BD626DRAFT_484634 [Auriculariopsis ampla]